ncbi:predicted protein [Histoplasma capsulatum H143]|uniref:Uncharacterized protein n=1 Tax=Ajellomyces capsulatus (strain H143) TaxID=544712 RepID=C6HTG0_AJECH|nr:predicted protein [Histoplasma capsulatum H143]
MRNYICWSFEGTRVPGTKHACHEATSGREWSAISTLVSPGLDRSGWALTINFCLRDLQIVIEEDLATTMDWRRSQGAWGASKALLPNRSRASPERKATREVLICILEILILVEFQFQISVWHTRSYRPAKD